MWMNRRLPISLLISLGLGISSSGCRSGFDGNPVAEDEGDTDTEDEGTETGDEETETGV